MAILESVPGVEVTIWCNGTELYEYPDTEEAVDPTIEDKVVTKYVQSTADAEFSLKLVVTSSYKLGRNDLGFFISLDGESDEAGILCGPQDLDKEGEWELDVRGWETVDRDDAKFRRFKFGKLLISTIYHLMKEHLANKTVAEDNIGYMSKKAIMAMRKVGLIEVRVYMMGKGSIVKHRTPKPQSREKVPEKVIKGHSISHSIA